MGLITAGVTAGDDVLVPTLNFAGCVNPIIYQGANPVFIDSESDTWNMNPILTREVILSKIAEGKKPKALLAVHLFGVPCKIQELLQIAKEFDIPLIEDSADAIGTTVNGQHVGTFGQSGVLSFNGNKIITTSGGGIFMCQNPDDLASAKHLSNQARSLKPFYQFDSVGYNYMMSNVLAGIGVGQMQVLEQRLEKRKYIFDYYNNELSSYSNLQFVDDLVGNQSNRWLTTLRINSIGSHSGNEIRNSIYNNLADQNIEARMVWKPMHLQPAFSKYSYFGNQNVAESIFDNGICLPSGSSLTNKDLDRIVLCIKDCLNKLR